MTSNSKPRLHLYRQDITRRQRVMVPVYRVSPEMANAIRRREGTAGVEYWNDMSANGVISRSARRMTVEEAFPRLHVSGHYENRHSSKHATKGQSHGDQGVPTEPKKAIVTDFRSLHSRDTPKTVQTVDPSRNYQMYSAKVRYVDVGTPGTNLATKSKPNKGKVSKLENIEKQNEHSSTQSNEHTNSKSEVSKSFSSSQSNGHIINGHVSNGHVETFLPSYRVKQPQDDQTNLDRAKRRAAWSEMTHLGVNGTVARISEPTFHKLGMNHTFRIPRPKATVSSTRNINLTASKKRAVSFGQDKVYEYTPLEPLNNYPINEELL